MTRVRVDPVRGFVVTVLLLLLLPGAVRAQLISPGKLNAVHASLEGITQCTQCHDIGERGVSERKCLGCHQPVERRIREGKGLHGRPERGSCGDCHSEHLGVDGRIVRFDTTGFDHRQAGFELVAAHRGISCRSCHRPSFVADPEVVRAKAPAGALSRTFLGLDPRCEGCHEVDDPHGGQFADPDCSRCHDESAWTKAPRFDHQATRYPLTGRHRAVACASCHTLQRSASGSGIRRFAGTSHASCAVCHRDPHSGRMGTRCADCHGTDGWSSLAGGVFTTAAEHSRTGFDLVGAHAAAPCSSCHSRSGSASSTVRLHFAAGSLQRRFPVPAHGSCADCHIDAHENGLPFRGASTPCTDCHDAAAWQPTSFGPDRHENETRFALTGAHMAVACSACHARDGAGPGLVFGRDGTECESCHGGGDPHGGQFSSDPNRAPCASCHVTDAWRQVSFSHADTRFPLSGRHADAECSSCHRATGSGPVIYRGLDASCVSCHAAADPHRGQFEARSCAECHDAESFHLAAFDHSRTRFPLDRAHRDVACARCHPLEDGPGEGPPFVRFRPLDTGCSSCHAS